MPERVINDTVFQYKDAEGRLLTAVRGEKVDIPEGEDLARGDKWGAFTQDGKEPKPPEGTFLPDIELEWTDEEYRRLADAATESEIIDKLNDVSDENRPEVARRLIEAESSRGDTAREELLAALSRAAEATSSPATGNPVPEGETGEPETGQPETGGEDLVEFVLTNTVEAVLERAGDDPELAKALREAEESRGDKARKGAIEGLTKIENPDWKSMGWWACVMALAAGPPPLTPEIADCYLGVPQLARCSRSERRAVG
jgi:hypothetical protein